MQITDINGRQRDCDRLAPDPDYPGYLKAEFVSKRRPDHRFTEWYPIADFLRYNPELEHLTQEAPPAPPDVTGRVTRATRSTITDSTRRFAPNIYAGYPLWISRGPGEGQKRTILKNSRSTLHLDSPWKTPPTSASQYVISKSIDKVQAAGNTLLIADLAKLEERARQFDLERGRTPAPRQYTKKT